MSEDNFTSQEPAVVSDEALVENVRSGEMESFDELMGRYKHKIYSTIYNMVSNHDEASDMLQETFIKAFKGIPTFKKDAKFSTWIYKIAVHTTLNHLKYRKRHPTHMSFDDMDLDEKEVDAIHHLVTQEMDPKEGDKEEKIQKLQKVLNDSLQTLSKEHRTVVVMHDVEEMTHAQIAEVLGIPEGTVKTRIFHAHKQLQKKLGKYLKQQEEEEES